MSVVVWRHEERPRATDQRETPWTNDRLCSVGARIDFHGDVRQARETAKNRMIERRGALGDLGSDRYYGTEVTGTK